MTDMTMLREGELYTLQHVTLITGLTERTIRSYIAKGFLKGEKKDGAWRFGADELEAFLRHPAVRPAITTKNNSILYDRLLGPATAVPCGCMVLDLPGEQGESIIRHFCGAINRGELKDVRFSFSDIGGTPRVILGGPVPGILELACAFFDKTQ